MTAPVAEVGWQSWEEWDSVRRGLVPGGGGDQQAALNLVRVWRARGPVAQAVDATADLVLALRDDVLGDASGLVDSGLEEQARLALSLLIARTVSGLTDKLQTRVQAQSVSQLARALQLPVEVSDIRHTAVHNALPTMAMLRFSAGRLLQWLERHYWEAQRERTLVWAANASSKIGSLLLSTRRSEEFGPEQVVGRLMEILNEGEEDKAKAKWEGVEMVLTPCITKRMIEDETDSEGNIDPRQVEFWREMFCALQRSSLGLFDRQKVSQTVGWRLVHSLLAVIEDSSRGSSAAVATSWLGCMLGDIGLGQACFDQDWPSSLHTLPLRRIVRASMLCAWRIRRAAALGAASRLYTLCGAEPHAAASAVFSLRSVGEESCEIGEAAVEPRELSEKMRAAAQQLNDAACSEAALWRPCSEAFTAGLSPGTLL